MSEPLFGRVSELWIAAAEGASAIYTTQIFNTERAAINSAKDSIGRSTNYCVYRAEIVHRIVIDEPRVVKP